MSTQYIKAPYNFVPVSNKVVFPYWADFVSHDIPFEDAQSGILYVRIKAHNSIFVRNGGPKKAKEEQGKQHDTNFSQANGQYFIPGSSLKGMIRNVLEVMTFSKMGNKITDSRFSYRDFYNKNLYNIPAISAGIKSGWLYKDKEGKYWVNKCGTPGRVKFNEIAEFLKKDCATFFVQGKKGFGYEGDNDEHKSAKFKYALFEGNNLEVIATPAPPPPPEKVNPYDLREKYNILSSASEGIMLSKEDRRGIIVFTGQPSARIELEDQKPKGKIYEFIFWESEGKPEEIKHKVIEDFYCAYLDNKSVEEQSIDWKYWKSNLHANLKIPVFYHEDISGKISSIGLSFLYKFAYSNSVANLTGQIEGNSPDLSELLFGFIQGDQASESLKSRIQFSHAFQIKAEKDEEKEEVLSSPRASYYPNYIRQRIRNGKVETYNTYNNEESQIAGWKRYPVHSGRVKHNHRPADASEDIMVKFTPLKAGAEFEFNIHYHNLKKIELGALLSALTFHKTPNVFHSLGMAKPLGYGKISLEIKGPDNQLECLRAFEAYMETEVNGWHNCNQIVELVTMASEQQEDSKLAYMNLELRNKNEFAEAKEGKEALDVYSKLRGVNTRTINLLFQSTDNELLTAEKAIYKKAKVGLTNKPVFIKKQEESFYEALKKKKEELIQELHNRRNEIENEAKTAFIIANAEIARSSKPDWDNIPLDRRNTLDELSRVIKLYVQKLNKGVAYEKLLKQRDGALLPEHLHEELFDIIQQIFNHSSKSEKENWIKPYEKNPRLKKVAEWIGDDNAKSVLIKLKSQ